MAGFGKPNATGRSTGVMTGRRGKLAKPPVGEPWVWLTRELLASDAWRSLSINARRFIDFLLIEQMNHAGTENGKLKAPYRQLQAHGLSAGLILDAITEAVDAGLVDRESGGQRSMTSYTLTWLPTDQLTPASNRWKRFKMQKSASQSRSNLHLQLNADAPNLHLELNADTASRTECASISRRDGAFSTEATKTPSTTSNPTIPRKSAAAADAETKLRGRS